MPEHSPLFERTGGGLVQNWHLGQYKAWHSDKRFVAVISGTQGGKTCFGPSWMYREIRREGPGDYIVITPTFQLLELKALPEFKKHFEDRLRLGTYKASPVRHFTFSEEAERRAHQDRYDPDTETRVLFAHAQDPDAVESATAKAAWADEAGQGKFKLGTWDALLRRLSLNQGRALITTTPYNLGWLYQRIYKPWRSGEDPDIDVIRFESRMNPVFPQAEWERAKRTLPKWKFDLFYRAIFTRPAGLIYDSFDEDRHCLPRFKIPASWPRYLGMDFGGVNTAAVLYAKNPESGDLYLYRTYKAGSRTAEQHARKIRRGEPGFKLAAGGAPSEGQWRREFRKAGLKLKGPRIQDVEVGIDRVYAHHATDSLYVFDDLDEYLEEKLTYSRELDDNDEPTEKIEDKETFHHMDAERYILQRLAGAGESRGGALANI